MTITRALPFADYLARESVHLSRLKRIDVSPLHYLRGDDRTDTDALRIGRAVHALLLTPDVADVAVWEEGARRGKAWQDFKSEHESAGRTIITAAEAEKARGMRAAIQAHPLASALLLTGDPEVTIEWKDPRTGLDCRARVDWLNGVCARGIVEIKTARASHPRAFCRACASMYYHAQLAFYADGYEASTGGPPASVHIIAVEKDPPHDVCVYSVGQEALDAGRRKVDGWLRAVAECAAAGKWPGASGDAAVELTLPDWALTDGIEDVDMSGIGSEEESHAGE